TRRASKSCMHGLTHALHAMEQRRAVLQERASREIGVWLRRRAEQAGDEFLQRTVARRCFKAEGHRFARKALEQLVEALMLDAPRKGAATHHPGIYLQGAPLNLAEQNGDFAQGAVLVFITYGQQK